MNGVVTGPVATYYLGAGYGGYLLSLTAAVAALISVPNTLKLYVHSIQTYYDSCLTPSSHKSVPSVTGTTHNYNIIYSRISFPY